MAKTKEEILINSLPADCYWEEMGNLTNCPERYVLKAMQQYADQQTSQLREELEAAKRDNEEFKREFTEAMDDVARLGGENEKLQKEIEKLKGDNDKLSAEVYGMFKIIGKALAKGTGHQTVPDEIIIRFIKENFPVEK